MTSKQSTVHKALQVLDQHAIDVEHLRMMLQHAPNHKMILVDGDEEEWAFTLRRRCRLFIMAKNKYMKHYEEIAVYSK